MKTVKLIIILKKAEQLERKKKNNIAVASTALTTTTATISTTTTTTTTASTISDKHINDPTDSKNSKKKKGQKKKKSRHLDSDEEKEQEDEEDSFDEDYKPSAKRSGEDDSEVTESKNVDAENPLPGFVDPITLEEVIQPAISPFGHVMGYKTWVRCLSSEPRNVCPLTKNPLHKRDLVILSWDNIRQLKDKIVNLKK